MRVPNSRWARLKVSVPEARIMERIIGERGCGKWLASRCQKPSGGSTGTEICSGAWSGKAVIGRACRRNSSPSARAHSMSCGQPKCASTCLATSATTRAWTASMAPSGAPWQTTSLPLTDHSSGVVSPETRRSPSPTDGADEDFHPVAGDRVGGEGHPGGVCGH